MKELIGQAKALNSDGGREITEEERQILKDAGLIAAKNLQEAAKLATEAEGGDC